MFATIILVPEGCTSGTFLCVPESMADWHDQINTIQNVHKRGFSHDKPFATFRNAPMGTPVGSILWCYAGAYQNAIHRRGLTPVHTAEPNSALTLRLCTFRVP